MERLLVALVVIGVLATTAMATSRACPRACRYVQRHCGDVTKHQSRCEKALVRLRRCDGVVETLCSAPRTTTSTSTTTTRVETTSTAVASTSSSTTDLVSTSTTTPGTTTTSTTAPLCNPAALPFSVPDEWLGTWHFTGQLTFREHRLVCLESGFVEPEIADETVQIIAVGVHTAVTMDGTIQMQGCATPSYRGYPAAPDGGAQISTYVQIGDVGAFIGPATDRGEIPLVLWHSLQGIWECPRGRSDCWTTECDGVWEGVLTRR